MINKDCTGSSCKAHPNCSCERSDSDSCISKNELARCSCDDCTQSKTCIFYSNRLIRVNTCQMDDGCPMTAMTSATGDNASCCNKGTEVATNTLESIKCTLELCKNLLRTPRLTIESLKNLYFQPKTEDKSSHDFCRNIIEKQRETLEELKKVYLKPDASQKQSSDDDDLRLDMDMLQDQNIPPDLYKGIIQTQMETIKTLKNIYCRESARRLKNDSPGFIMDVATPEKEKTKKVCCQDMPQTHGDSRRHRLDSGGYFDVGKDKRLDSCCPNYSETQVDAQRNRLDSSGYVYDLSKLPHEPKEKKICCQSSASETQGNTQRHRLDSGGYVSDLSKFQDYGHETKRASFAPDVAGDTKRNRLDSRGYVYDVSKISNVQDDSNKCCQNASERAEHSEPQQQHGDSRRHRLDSGGWVYDISKLEDIDMDKLGDTKRTRLDSRGYVYDLSKTTNAKEDTKKCCQNTSDTQKGDTRRHRLDSGGYIYDMSKLEDLDMDKLGDRRRSRLDSRGYVYNLPKDTNEQDDIKKCCQSASEPYSNAQRHRLDSGGYVSDLSKFQDYGADKLGDTKRNRLDSRGYVYDLSSSASELSRYKKKDICCRNISEIEEEEICSKNASEAQISRSSCGHRYDDSNAQRTCKHRFDKNKQMIDAISTTIQQKKKCECKDTSQKTVDSSEGADDTDKDTGSVNLCVKGTPKIHSHHKESCSCKSSSKPHESKKSNVELCKNILEIQRNAIETLNSIYLTQKHTSCRCNETKQNFKSCHCSESMKDPSEQIGYQKQHKCQHTPNDSNLSQKSQCICSELQKKNCFCNESINIPSEQSSNLKQHKCQHKSTESHFKSHGKSINEPIVFVVQPQKCPIKPTDAKAHCECDETQKKTCYCNEATKIKPKPAGYIIEVKKTANEPTVVGKHQHKCPHSLTDTCFTQKNQTESKGFEVKPQKCPIKPTDPKNHCDCDETERKTCFCNESTKVKPKPPGYIIEIQKDTKASSTLQKPQTDKCGCEGQKAKCQIPKFLLEIQKDSSNTQKMWINRVEMINHKKKCECSEPTKVSSKTSGLLIELKKIIDEPSNNSYKKLSCECNPAEAFPKEHNEKPTMNPNDETKKNENKDICSCDDNNVDKSKYRQLQNTQELCKTILERQKKTIETLKNIYLIQKSMCDCKALHTLELKKTDSQKNTIKLCTDLLGPPKTSIEALKNIYLPSKTIKPDDAENKRKQLQNTQELCKTILERQRKAIETLKSIYLMQKNICNCKKTNSQKNTTKLCTDILGPPKTSIEALKSIYLPPKKKTFSKDTTKLCSDLLGPPKTSIDALKNIYLTPKTKSIDKPALDKDVSSDTAMLTAEVMDIPYRSTKLSKYDIFKRIKEAYKACSCKVCECIVGKTAKNELCKCKPCECADCMNFLDKHNFKPSRSRFDCKCNKSSCKSATKRPDKRQACDCVSCDCLKCSMKSTKPCDCEPCQCIECKALSIHLPQTLVVAPVGENVQRAACTCSPCDCIECGTGFPASSSVMHEMSTGTNRHALCRCEVCLNEACDQSGVDACKCQTRNKVMSKPVEKDTHDFDIRTVSIVHNKMFHGSRTRSNRHDTLAMFAALSNTFPTFTSNNNRLSSTKTCTCGECECISCVCKEGSNNTVECTHLVSFNKTKRTSYLNFTNKSNENSTKTCKCQLCECQICENLINNEYHIDNEFDKEVKYKTSCKCFPCDCLSCEGDQSEKYYALCKCSSCECTDCKSKQIRSRKMFRDSCHCSTCRCEQCYGESISPNSIVHPIKKGAVLTPSTHQTKVQGLLLEKQRLDALSDLITKKDSSSKIKDHDNFFKTPSEFINKPTKVGVITNVSDNEPNNADAIHTTANDGEVLKCDAYMQCQDRYKGKTLLKNNSIDNESCFSGLSSFETSPITSCHKDYDSISPISRTKNKSWESSCNSSGHDYPEYLIKFPKSTVETCLKDVMELDMDKTVRLDKFNIIPKHTTTENRTYKMAHDNLSEKEKLSLLSNDSDLIDNRDSKVILNKQPESIKPHKTQSSHDTVNHDEFSQWNINFSDNLNGRNYNFELSNGLNLHLSRQNDKQNSQKNHEANLVECNQINDTKSFTLTKNPKYYHVVQNFNEVHSKELDYNISEQKQDLKTLKQNEEFCTLSFSEELPHSYIVNEINTLNIDEDYKRVQKTLQETKEFSMELMRLLEMYEKANKEFESVSEKLKTSHDSIYSCEFTEQKQITNTEDKISAKCVVGESHVNEMEHELREIHLEAPSIKEKNTSTSVLHNKGRIPERTFAECAQENNTITQKFGRTNLSMDILNYKKESKPIEEIDSSVDRLESIYENNIVKQIEENLNQDQFFHGSATEFPITIEGNSSMQETKEIFPTSDNLGIKKKERVNIKNHKKYSKLMKRTIIISKRVSVKNSNQVETAPVVKYFSSVGTSTTAIASTGNDDNNDIRVNTFGKKSEENGPEKKSKGEIHHVMRKLNTVFGSTDEISVSTSTDPRDIKSNRVYVRDTETTIAPDIEETKPWSILKKNVEWNTASQSTKIKGVCIFPSLELEIKEAVQSISLQTGSTSQPIKKIYHENKALVKLQDEVKKLLDMPILQPQCSATPECTKEALNLPHKSKLELELKETPEVSLQTKRKDVNQLEKGTLTDLNENIESQIRELLNLTVLQALLKKNLFEESEQKTNLGGPKSSCDALKVGSLDVRRVSDHTVLVKWNVPRELSKVQGYELLVDGRAVPTVFSPSKSMAVVTCLPHTDRVLLTMRTITSHVSETGHYPATTVVYRPRNK